MIQFSIWKNENPYEKTKDLNKCKDVSYSWV